MKILKISQIDWYKIEYLVSIVSLSHTWTAPNSELTAL